MKLLCRPCAEELKKQGKKLVEYPLRPNTKITCEACNRRRYGKGYEVNG